MTHVVNCSIRSNEFPVPRKKAIITSIHKSGSADLGPVLRSSIRGLARYVELKAWVSCTTKVNLFKRRCITMVTYARNQTWSGAAFQLSLPGDRLLKSACSQLPSPSSDNGVAIFGCSRGPLRTIRTGVSLERQNRSPGIV